MNFFVLFFLPWVPWHCFGSQFSSTAFPLVEIFFSIFLKFFLERKNQLQFPLQFFVALTNEGVVVPFGVGGMRYERQKDYMWLMEAFFECFKSLPKCMIVDGDDNISDAISRVAETHNCVTAVLLCVWHVYENIKVQLPRKGVSIDEFALKKDFYSLRLCASEDVFETQWSGFLKKYGTSDSAESYLTNHVYSKRERFVQAWTGAIFSAKMSSSSISESFHSLLASGKSSFNSLTQILILVDKISLKQLQESKKRSSYMEKILLEMDLASGGGFCGLSAAPFLSDKGWRLFSESMAHSLYCSVSVVENIDEFAQKSFQVQDLRFNSDTSHIVSIYPFKPPLAGSDLYLRYHCLDRSLGRNVELGKSICAACHAKDAPGGEDGSFFVLPARWELLYQGKYSLTRVIVALGIGLPKEPGSTNNTTIGGLKEVISEYEARVERYLADGLEGREAQKRAVDEMRRWIYGGSALGVPRINQDKWIQCGVAGDEKELPAEHKRDYCGKWFHLGCIGLHRAPKSIDERIQCLECLQVRQFRPKLAPIEAVSQAAVFRADGRPRVLEDEEGSRIRTIRMECNCKEQISSGMPCLGMCAVAITEGGVISFHSYHPHWWNSAIIGDLVIQPIFQANQRHVLAVDAVIGDANVQDAPSARGPNVRAPAGAEIVSMANGKENEEQGDVRITISGTTMGQNETLDLHGVELGPGVSRRKHSRRHKVKHPKK